MIDELKDELKLCDYSQEGLDVVVTEEDSTKTAELKRRFVEEKEKYDKMKLELFENQKTLMDYHKVEMAEMYNSTEWQAHSGNSGVTYEDYLSGAPTHSFEEGISAKDISYYSYLCGNFDTHCDPCDFKSKKKAGCPETAFCFQKKGVAQCGSCKKWGEKCEKCSLTQGC